MTPTLALVVERENAIEGFKKKRKILCKLNLDCGFPAASDQLKEREAAG